MTILMDDTHIQAGQLTFLARYKREVLAYGHVRVHYVSAETRVQVLRSEVVLDVVEAKDLLGRLQLLLVLASQPLANRIRLAKLTIRC